MPSAIIWFGGGGHCADPHTNVPLPYAHPLVEATGSPVCGGGTTANVGEAMCAMGWFKCWGSWTNRRRTRMAMRTGGGMGATEAKEGETKEEGHIWDWARAMQGRCMHDARAPHRRCAENPVSFTMAATRIRS